MKGKKILVGISILIVLILIIVLVIFLLNKKDSEEKEEKKTPKSYTISYSYSGGFTTYAGSLKKIISIDQDGNGKIELDIEDSLVEPLTFKVNKEDVKELMDFLVDNKFCDLKEDLSVNDVLDAGSSYMEVKSDTCEHRVGGYAASLNKDFDKFSKKFWKLVDNEKVDEFRKMVEEKYDNY